MGNCLGGTHLDQYLKKTEGDNKVYLIRDERDKFMVAIEYNKKTRVVTQIEANLKVHRTIQVNEKTVNMSKFIECLCELVKAIQPRIIRQIDHLESFGPLSGKVITTDGKLSDKIGSDGTEIPQDKILWPTFIFGKVENVELPESEGPLDPLVFMSPRKPKLKPGSTDKYIEAGINDYLKAVENFAVKSIDKPNNLVSIELQKRSSDVSILKMLGIVTGPNGEITNETDQTKLWSLEEIQLLLQKQIEINADGKIADGPLLTTSQANIFYVKTHDNTVRSFWFFWDDHNKKWHLNTLPFPNDWSFGGHIFARNFTL
jgi:hypothetical protein